jgi:hypothetical protein
MLIIIVVRNGFYHISKQSYSGESCRSPQLSATKHHARLGWGLQFLAYVGMSELGDSLLWLCLRYTVWCLVMSLRLEHNELPIQPWGVATLQGSLDNDLLDFERNTILERNSNDFLTNSPHFCTPRTLNGHRMISSTRSTAVEALLQASRSPYHIILRAIILVSRSS